MIPIPTKRLSESFYLHPWLWLLSLLLTLIPSLYWAMQLPLQSDFKYLLPQNKPSVINLNRIVGKVGGVGSLVVAIECDDYRATEKFINAFVERLKSMPPGYVRYVDYNVSRTKEFFTKNKYLYIDLADLQSIHDRLAKKIRFEKLRQNPFYIALDEDRADFDLSDIEAKYNSKTSRYNYQDGYFFSDDLRLAAVTIKPFGSSTGTGFSKELIAQVQKVIDATNPASFYPSMKVSFAGKFKKTLEEYAQLKLDMLETLGLTLFLVGFVIYLYFLRFRSVWILTLPLTFGAAWTFALTKFQIGHLNSQTAFLGSIIVGNGVNSGIILFARYLEERRANQDIRHAIFTAVDTTWLGTFTAAMTTSAAFAALGLSEIKGFSEFGFIGGVGMMLCWFATYLALPPLLIITDRINSIVVGKKIVSKQWELFLRPVGSLVSTFPRLVTGLGLLLAVLSTVAFVQFVPNSLEYDFSKLRNRPRTAPVPGGSIYDRVDEIFKQELSPVIILLDREEQAAWICDVVMKKEAQLPPSDQTIDNCKTLQSYLPENQEEKLVLLKKIRKLLADSSLNFVKPKYRKEIDEFRASVNVKKIEFKELPETIKRNFQELDGNLGRITYIFPRRDAQLTNGERLIRFADSLSVIRLPDGSEANMSGEAAIFADLLRAVKHDGPITTVFAFLVVALVVVLNFRRRNAIIYTLGGLVIGVTYLLGLEAILHIKLNFFNFIALPVTFGIGVDYICNLLQRYRYEGRGSIRKVLVTVGGAIVLCSLTTLIGYATLLTATNQALASFGWLGLLGEMACLFSAIVVMPALLHSYENHT